MTQELELEQIALDDLPKSKLVEPKPLIDNVPAKSKRRISRWVAPLAMLGLAAGGARFWMESR